MSSWADQSEQPDHGGGPSAGNSAAPSSRPRLNLKPRSAQGVAAATSGGASRKSNPFGAAKPREDVLASKGIDAHIVDNRIEKKAAVRRFTSDQERDVEKLRGELTKIEEDMREANENELPEEEYRVAAEEKRTELNDLMAKFAESNLGDTGGLSEKSQQVRSAPQSREGNPVDNGGRPKYERPSERRRRAEQQRQQESGGGGGGGGYRGGGHDERDGGDDAYASFGGRTRPIPGKGEGGEGGNEDNRGSYQDRGDNGRGFNNDRSGGNDNAQPRARKEESFGDNKGGFGDNLAGDRYNF